MTEISLFLFGCAVSIIAMYAFIGVPFAKSYYRDNELVPERPSDSGNRSLETVKVRARDVA